MRGYLRELWGADRVVARVVVAFALFSLGAIAWDMPGAWGWENDGIAPRDFLAGIALNVAPGSGHRYPLLHNLLVAIPCLPALVVAVLQADALTYESIRASLLTPPIMTWCALSIRAVSVLFSSVTVLVVGRIARRLFDARTARFAAAALVVNLSFSYYGRASNLDGPYLMWIALAVDRLLDIRDRGAPGDYARFGLFAAAAVATKDQAYAAFVLVGPLYLVALPALRPSALAAGRGHWWGLLRAIAFAAGGYAVLCGAIVNPTGFLARVEQLTGPNAQDWRVYEPGFAGWLANLQDLFFAQAAFWWPWPVVVAAWVGAGIAAARRGDRVWRLLPLAAGLSSLLAFTLVVGRTEHRFVLPLGAWLSVYVGVLFAALGRPGRWLAVAGLAWAAVGPMALWLTQWTDARRPLTAWLAERPRGATVEVYGKLVYLPHLDVSKDAPYRVRRVSGRDPKRRDPIIGADEVKGPRTAEAARARGADILVIPEGWVGRFLPRATKAGEVRAEIASRAQRGGAAGFFRAAVQDDLPGYRHAFVAEPGWPRALSALGIEPVEIHGSTGRRVWVLERDAEAPAR